MAQIVAAALVSHGPLVTGRPRCGCTRDPADLAGYELRPAERAALKDGDITGLYRLGANPYLIRRVFRSRFRI